NVYNRLGEPEHAAQFFRQALSRFQEIGDRDGEAQVHNGLGEAALAAGRPEESLACHTEARALAAAIGARAQQARALAGLGNARRSLGHLARARGDYTQALAL